MPGARIGFKTDAKEFTVKVSLKTLSPDIAMSIYACQSVSVMIGDRQNAVFAGNAKGELEIADYINTIDMSLFIMDYDHNAPTTQHLRNTHETFFKHIRENNPTLPILMISRPDYDYYDDGLERREIIQQTYNNAVRSGGHQCVLYRRRKPFRSR